MHTNLGAGEPHNAIIELVNMKQASATLTCCRGPRQRIHHTIDEFPRNGNACYFLIRFDAKGAQNARKQIDAPHRILCGAQPYNRFIRPLGFADRPLNGPVR